MDIDFSFFFNSILLGVGLGMDAFSISLVNGLNEPLMKKRKMYGVSSIFALFQFVVSFISWLCVSTITQYFTLLEKIIPYIALILLCFIGGKMLYEGIKNKEKDEGKPAIGIAAIFLQGFATSIDEAFSVGFAIAQYSWLQALISCLMIGIVTFGICFAGIIIGKKAGTKLADKADILGGAILIFIGLEIFITSFFG